MERYIDDKKSIYRLILQFLENYDEPDNDDSIFDNLIENIKNQQIINDPDEMRQFLHTIKLIKSFYITKLKSNKTCQA